MHPVWNIAAKALAVATMAAAAWLLFTPPSRSQGVTDGISDFYLTQGVLGVSCAVLGLVIIYLWRAREKDRVDHKVELAAKDALINQLQEQRLAEALTGRDIIKTFQATLDAFLVAVRGGKGMQ